MTSRRRYVWHCDPADLDAALLVLEQRATETPQFFSDVSRGGTAVGVGEVSAVVSDRDRWWVQRRVRLLHEDLHLLWGITLVNEVSQKLPPHEHPNRAARWRKEKT